VTSGVKNDWDKIKGAKDALDDPKAPVCSVYRMEYAEKARRLGNEFKGGRAIFTEPPHPIRCCSAPQQIMYLLADKWSNKKLKVDLHYNTANNHLFRVPIYNNELLKIAKSYNAELHYQSTLVEVRKDDRVAVFKQDNGILKEEKFDFLHLVPTSSPHSYIAESGLGDSSGYCDVDEHYMRHKKFPNIWSIGDASSLPCSKTAAALYTQTDVFLK
jgi:NADPH-dependent 2,4-dienoyl-CoA reductase/sulfur reductase-like enzyme